MLTDFANIFIFAALAILLVFVSLLIGKLIRPNNPNPMKQSVYECGEPPVGSGFSQFNMRFYLIAFVFVIFDVEIAFMYPVTVVFKNMLQKLNLKLIVDYHRSVFYQSLMNMVIKEFMDIKF